MSAPELSDAERAVVDRFEAADPAPESLRERVARALWDAEHFAPTPWPEGDDIINRGRRGEFRRLADAAIAVMRGDQ